MRTVLTAIVIVAAAAVGSVVGRAQPKEAPDVLAALLIEVRGLRAAMEQMASSGPRVQLALGRLQLQEQRVNGLVRRLTEVRSDVSQTQKALEAAEQQIKALDQAAREAADADERRDAEHELKVTKAEAPRLAAEVQRLLAEEATLSQELAVEQGRWNEINQRLEELERALGRK
jgi:predicted  nucleic acid-binding Zn-ribbon protein